MIIDKRAVRFSDHQDHRVAERRQYLFSFVWVLTQNSFSTTLTRLYLDTTKSRWRIWKTSSPTGRVSSRHGYRSDLAMLCTFEKLWGPWYGITVITSTYALKGEPANYFVHTAGDRKCHVLTPTQIFNQPTSNQRIGYSGLDYMSWLSSLWCPATRYWFPHCV